VTLLIIGFLWGKADLVGSSTLQFYDEREETYPGSFLSLQLSIVNNTNFAQWLKLESEIINFVKSFSSVIDLSVVTFVELSIIQHDATADKKFSAKDSPAFRIVQRSLLTLICKLRNGFRRRSGWSTRREKDWPLSGLEMSR